MSLPIGTLLLVASVLTCGTSSGKMDEDSDLVSQLRDMPQRIEFAERDDYSHRLLSNNVTVLTNAGHQKLGSSQVQLKNVVDYVWDHKYYTGHILAVHSSEKYLGYALKKMSNKLNGVVRVMNINTKARALLKGQEGTIVDLAFACIPSEVVLASMDDHGRILIYDIKETSVNDLVCTLLMHIMHEAHIVNRIIWCPFVPYNDSKSQKDLSKLIAVTSGANVDLWNIPVVAQKYGTGPLESKKIIEGHLCIEQHSWFLIIDAFISPDGTAIAIASFDGYVKFYLVDITRGNEPKLLHKWNPHNGKRLSSLFFLDNRKNIQPDAQIWKFAVTGAEDNSEIKIWCCETWSCLQTICFEAQMGQKDMILKPGLDLESNYLLLSDLNRRVLFVLDILKDDCSAVFGSVSQFLLSNPILDFSIVDAGEKKFKDSSLNFEDVYGDNEIVDDTKCIKAVLVRMFLVQQKSLQECNIIFEPVWPEDEAKSLQDLNKNDLDVSDLKLVGMNVSPKVEKHNSPVNEMLSPLQSTSFKEPPLKLMTPDAFFASVKQINAAMLKHIERIGNASAIPTPNIESPIDLMSMSPLVTQKMMTSPSLETALVLDGEENLQEKLIENEATEENNISMNVLSESSGFSPQHQQVEVLCNNFPNQPSVEDSAVENLDGPSNTQASQNIHDTPYLADSQVNFELLADSLNFVDARLESYFNTIFDSQVEYFQGMSAKLEEHDNNIKQFFKQMKQDNSEQQERMLERISQTVGDIICPNIKEVVKKEMKNKVLPRMEGTLESTKMDFLFDARQEMTSAENCLKEKVAHFFSNDKNVADAIADSTVEALETVIEKASKAALTSFLNRDVKKFADNVLSQVEKTFIKGTEEYIGMVQGHMEKYFENSKRQEMSNQVQLFNDCLQANNAELISAIRNEFPNMFPKSLMESTADDLRKKMHEILEIMESKEKKSHDVTPSSRSMILARIKQLLYQGQVNAAFEQALSASDLELVAFICGTVDPEEVFSQDPCPLQQEVLLSLIQQLSVDMSNHNEVRQRYLEEAVMNLDPQNPTYCAHIKVILTNLIFQLRQYIDFQPKGQFARNLKKLSMIAESILKLA